MKELLVARQAQIKDRTAALNRQKVVRSPLLRRQLTSGCARSPVTWLRSTPTFSACVGAMRISPHAWRFS
jgi:hypothetical protein